MEEKASKNLCVSEECRYERSGIVRYILCASLFINCFLLYAMRLNLSVSITAMVNSTADHNETFSNETCRNPNLVLNTTSPDTASTVKSLGISTSFMNPPPRYRIEITLMNFFHKGEFDWSQSQQAMITYAFFVGYLLSQIPGGYMAQTYSLKWVLGLGMVLTSLLTCATSFAARTSFHLFLALRVLEGLCEGVTFPAIFVFVSKWVPVQEQGFLVNSILAGANVGTVVTMPVSALLCASSWGWPASFYIFGFVGLVFSALWLLYAADDPEQHRWISIAECNYIVQNRPSAGNSRSKSVPWKGMLLSSAVWLLLLERLGATLNYMMILTELPSYLKDMFGINIVKNGVITGGMIMGLSFSLVGSGWIADRILDRKLASKNLVRKFCVAITCLVPSLCMLLVPQVGCNDRLVLVLMFVNCLCMGFSGGGDSLLSLDIAPEYAGTIQGAVGCVGALAGVLAPLFVGVFTDVENSLSQWDMAFYCIAIMGASGATLFLLFGSTEEQPWAKCRQDEDETALCRD